MDRQMYKILKQAHRNNGNEQELKKIKLSLLPNPLMVDRVNLLLGNINVNVKFSDLARKFSNLENSPAYKDELIVTYLLFLAKILNNSLLLHVFYVPQSQNIFNWILLYKRITYSIITLLYNKKFTDEDFFNMDIMVHRLNEGYFQAVRQFLNRMKLLTISEEQLEIEKKYSELIVITSDDFGPFYWRILHFMAEAINIRKHSTLAKTIWKEFVLYSLHRTLLCSICKEHYKTVAEKFKQELQNSSIDYAKLWFDIHNHVNKSLNKTEYTREEFEKDQSIMKNLLITSAKF